MDKLGNSISKLERLAGEREDMAEALELAHHDPRIVEVFRTYRDWMEPTNVWAELVRKDGAKVGISGVTGKSWGAEVPGVGTLRKGRSIRRFKSPSAAILAIEADYPSR